MISLSNTNTFQNVLQIKFFYQKYKNQYHMELFDIVHF